MRKIPGFLLPALLLTGCALSPCALPAAEIAAQASATLGLASLPAEERGDLMMARGRYLEAVEAYRQANQTAVVLNKMGIAYQHLSAVDLARKDYQKALLIRPDYPEALNNLGAAYFAKRDYKKAIRLYQKALKLMPDNAVIAANMGTAYFARRDYRHGLAAYQRAFQLDPGVFGSDTSHLVPAPSDRVDRAQQDFCIAELFAQSGKLDLAVDYLRKAFDEGFKDRSKVMEEKAFAQLRTTAQFAQFMAEEKQH